MRRLEREIEKQEQLLAELSQQLEAAATDYQQLLTLTQERQEQEEILNDLMEQWEAAVETNE